ncbi:ABC transporter type 1, transmembrane domain-containing protein [Pavlovales sp. CCMP2436]|nr:ABC transporter type 1, transmembrane domain-containing protein [Pavlovales sp. CCMP2436]
MLALRYRHSALAQAVGGLAPCGPTGKGLLALRHRHASGAGALAKALWTAPRGLAAAGGRLRHALASSATAVATGASGLTAAGPAPPPSYSPLTQLVWPERHRLAAGVALSFVGAGLSLAFPAAIGRMVDITLAPETAAVGPVAACAALLAIFVGQAVVLAVRARLLTRAGEGISASMRTRAFGSLLRQEIAFFDRHESGELLNRLSADCAQLQKVVSSTMAQALRSVTMAAGSTAMLLALSPQLAALILAVFPAVFAFGAWQGRAMRGAPPHVQKLLAPPPPLAARSLGSLRTLRALGVERSQMAQYASAIDEAKEQFVVFDRPPSPQSVPSS